MHKLKIKKYFENTLIPRVNDNKYIIYAPSDQKLWPGIENTIYLGFELKFSLNYVGVVSSKVLPMREFLINSNKSGEVFLTIFPKEIIFIEKASPIATLTFLKIELPTIILEDDSISEMLSKNNSNKKY